MAQDNYEIQVYGSELLPADHTMVELHANYTVLGSTQTSANGELPTQGQLHGTLEITHGWNSWLETGFYVFTSYRWDQGYQWVGTHFRPRVTAPKEWGWPVGVSLSMEVGYQKPAFSADTWSLEVRPIIDKQIGPWYLAFNPTLDVSLAGPNVRRGPIFSPNAKVSYEVTPKMALGLEYYGTLGPPFNFDTSNQQQHMLCPAVDLDLGPDLECNFGVCFGLTSSTDRLIPKLLIGRRFDF